MFLFRFRERRRRRHRSLRELFKPSHRALAKQRRVPRDGGFSGALDSRDATIERLDELVELPHEIDVVYRHELTPLRTPLRREAFQISPQLPHLQ
jgi:hypothetical protein